MSKYYITDYEVTIEKRLFKHNPDIETIEIIFNNGDKLKSITTRYDTEIRKKLFSIQDEKSLEEVSKQILKKSFLKTEFMKIFISLPLALAVPLFQVSMFFSMLLAFIYGSNLYNIIPELEGTEMMPFIIDNKDALIFKRRSMRLEDNKMSKRINISKLVSKELNNKLNSIDPEYNVEKDFLNDNFENLESIEPSGILSNSEEQDLLRKVRECFKLLSPEEDEKERDLEEVFETMEEFEISRSYQLRK